MDTVGDMLTIIRNGLAAHKRSVLVPFSKFKFEISRVIKEKGFVENVIKTTRGGKRMLEIVLKYDKEIPRISGIRRTSTPGRRVYAANRKIPLVKLGRGITIVSTPQGVLSDKEARQKGIGGEVICQIW